MRVEIHQGVVVDNRDPERRGGLKIRVDTLLQDLPFVDRYIPASFPYAGNQVGFFFVPDVGAQVEVEVETDPERFLEDVNARWRGVLYSANDPIPPEFASDYPNRAGIKFGELIVMLDKQQDIMALIAGNVRLGSEGASEAVVLGDSLAAKFDALNLALPAIVGGTPAQNASAIAALVSALTNFSSSSNGWLSTVVKTD